MFPVTLFILSFWIFHKAENAQITATSSGMTCPNNWAVGVSTLQIDITDPATTVTGISSVTLTYQTTTEPKTCDLTVRSTSCDVNTAFCTDAIFSGITCAKTATTPLEITWMAPAPLSVDQHNARIAIRNGDSQISGWTDDTYTLNVINGPTTLDGNAKTSSAMAVLNDMATFTCLAGFSGNSFTRTLTACAEWTGAENTCTAIPGSSELTGGQIAGIVVGCVVCVALIGIGTGVAVNSFGNDPDDKIDGKPKENSGRGRPLNKNKATSVLNSNEITTESGSNETPQ